MPEFAFETIIRSVRHQRVILDFDLASIYGVTTKQMNQQVRRNRDRFPPDFMFQLNQAEFENLRSQIATANPGDSRRRFLPYAFTEHGAVMLASVLKTPTAVEASIQVVRAFIQLRQLLSTHSDLARKLKALERKYDDSFKAVFEALRKLMEPPSAKSSKKIGFHEDR